MRIMKPKYRYCLFFFPSIFLLFSLFSISSCEKQDIAFGTGFIDNTITNLVLVDTATVNIASVYIDSFVTSSSKAIFAGKFKDEKFGTTTSQSFLQLGIPAATSYAIPNGSIFDSVELILKPNKIFYGDTTALYELTIHQLTQQITYRTNQYSFYNNNSWPYSNTILGSSQLVISPSIRDTLSIKLAGALGLDLFNKLQNKNDEVSTVDRFLNYFKGIAIVGGTANNCILGFKDSVIMRLHYRKPGVFAQSAIIDFSLNQSNFQFNNISTDRTGTAISTLGPNNRVIPASATGNAGYSQYISGVIAKLNFPYLNDLYQLPNFLKIVKAELVIKPVQNSFLNFYNLPPFLRLNATNQTNLPGNDLSAQTGSGSSVQYGNLYIDNLYGTNTAYTYDITSYMQSLLLSNSDLIKNGLLVLPPAPNITFNRILIANGANSINKTQVKIYYASVK